MALLKTVSTVHGFQAVNAYHRVEGVRLDSKTTMSFHVRSYTATEKPFFVESVLSCAYALDGDNPIKQAYKYLKTLPEFADALDC
jgi:galactose mutarotase-like enzyme